MFSEGPDPLSGVWPGVEVCAYVCVCTDSVHSILVCMFSEGPDPVSGVWPGVKVCAYVCVCTDSVHSILVCMFSEGPNPLSGVWPGVEVCAYVCVCTDSVYPGDAGRDDAAAAHGAHPTLPDLRHHLHGRAHARVPIK